MAEKISGFVHDTRGSGRPQIVMIGNGLELGCGQPDWEKLIQILKAPNCIELSKEELEQIPFPLQYQLLSTAYPGPSQFTQEAISLEEQRLAKGVGKLNNVSNALLDTLPDLGADHIFTTNYSYCLEKAFFPEHDFTKKYPRNKFRFNLSDKNKKGNAMRDLFRLHSGYLSQNADGSYTALWHIHGEISAPTGIIVGHDRYGRLLSRMEMNCGSQRYEGSPEAAHSRAFRSWPELFLYGDVYIIGLGYYFCEYDLWWLLRRKQRERYADGHVYFYDNGPKEKHHLRDLELQAHGVIYNPGGLTAEAEYATFYEKALEDVRSRIAVVKSERIQEPSHERR